MAGRQMLAGLELLDRQLIDRHGRLAGKVDDVELTALDDSNQLYVTALYSGHGSLWRRLGARRLAAWLERLPLAPDARIPMGRVAEMGATIRLGADRDELATYAGEAWVAEHVIAHIPGSRHAAE